jgi:hypothetical protein
VIGAGLPEHGGDPLVAPNHFVAHGRDVVLPGARSEEVQVLLACAVLGEYADEVAPQFALAQRGGQIQRTRDPMVERDLAEQLRDIVDADRVEHLPLNGGNGIRHVGMGGLSSHERLLRLTGQTSQAWILNTVLRSRPVTMRM